MMPSSMVMLLSRLYWKYRSAASAPRAVSSVMTRARVGRSTENHARWSERGALSPGIMVVAAFVVPPHPASKPGTAIPRVERAAKERRDIGWCMKTP